MIEFFNEDCFERFKKLEDNSIDAAVTDPPYGIAFSGKTSNTNWDNLSDEDYYKLLCTFFSECQRVLKTGGTLWMCFGRTKIQTVFQALNDFDKDKRVENDRLQVNLENWLTYARQKGRSSSKKFKSQAEEIFHITKGEKWTWNPIEYLREVVAPYTDEKGKPRGWFLDQNTGMRMRWTGLGNVLAFSAPSFNSLFEKQIHSTQKPFLLFTELIMLSTKQGETVFDPFAGSGVSGIAADCCGRNWIGCELDKEMFAKANNWIHNYDKTLAEEYYKSRIRGMTKEKTKDEVKPKKFTLNTK